MSVENEDEDEKDYKPKKDLATQEWDKEHDTGMSCGTCPRCGSKIYQSTYADFCKCGDSDQGY